MRTDLVLIAAGFLLFATSCYAKDHPDAAIYTSADRDGMKSLVNRYASHPVTVRAKSLRDVPDFIEQAVQANCEQRTKKSITQD